MPKRSSSVAGREFGAGVRAVIARTGLTHRQLAERIGWQEAKLSDMTLGKGGVSEVEVQILLAYCQATVEEREYLLALFRESGKAWLQMPEDGLPDQVRTLIDQERDAEEIICWSMIVVPGLLQTHEYAYVVAEHSTVIKAEDVPRVAAARAARADILEPGKKFTFFVHEQALLLPAGGTEVWREQLAHLLRMSVRKYISLRIIPRAAGMHAGICGDFRVMKFPKYPSVVYIDSINSCLFFDDADTVKVYEDILTALAAVALAEEESRAVIDNILEGL
ncbi:helix-turn-helix domain-containing protein [Lentzea flaviverrucosa]|uniref:Helix-turn-helix domain-containing protein n=1 Tax=Lentzea flaviverrucosa TaxID=200379 RepID=A0A1H9X5Y4_9PSEU|nr:helix-turn-helix transcriptional regulator [Lentzea flaviverrucosa]RDI20800.1 helix-turn-helix protein [Lentzea flaviverrucosa]SES41489.1 Helix-turn-helix domain-containing protein [Lentzea flaviverrucosa]